MESRRFGNQWVVRIDKGEEVVGTLKRFCSENGVRLGSVGGIGAADSIRVGLFRTGTREYVTTDLKGDFEITSLTGNISTMAGQVYLHLHITLSDADYRAFGGHLNTAVVSGTCELVVTEMAGEMDREFDPGVGLNLYKF